MLDESTLTTIRKISDQTNLAYAQIQPVLSQFNNIKINIPNIILPNFLFSERIKEIANEIANSYAVQQSFALSRADYFERICVDIKRVMESVKIPQSFFDSIKEFWKFWNKRKAKICKKYGYFISANIPKEFEEYLLKAYNDRLSKKYIDKKVFEIYKKNNWKSLDFHKKWKENTYLAKRLPAIKDAISILRKSQKSPHRVILPLLISQINGILLDIAKAKDISFNFMAKKGGENKKTDKKIREEVLEKIKQNELDLQDEVAINLIENILFAEAKVGKPLNKNLFHFNRHKVLHGEDVKGLTKSNMIRAFLLLDFLAHFLLKPINAK